MVVDTSALIAVFEREPEAEAFKAAFEASEASFISSVNFVETGAVLAGRSQVYAPHELRRLLGDLGVTVSNQDIASEALDAYLFYGRGFHVARLNLGDCFSYALAKRLRRPLLYKGRDFLRTDIEAVVQPT